MVFLVRLALRPFPFPLSLSLTARSASSAILTCSCQRSRWKRRLTASCGTLARHSRSKWRCSCCACRRARGRNRRLFVRWAWTAQPVLRSGMLQRRRRRTCCRVRGQQLQRSGVPSWSRSWSSSSRPPTRGPWRHRSSRQDRFLRRRQAEHSAAGHGQMLKRALSRRQPPW